MAWKNYKNNGKYNAKKTVIDGVVFDSKKEARRWLYLQQLQKAGEISGLMRQVKFVLIPTQYEPGTVGPRGGYKRGQLLEKECAYYADFMYEQNGQTVVEDTKGMRTPEYVIKRKLMLEKFGVRIVEV